MKFQIVIVIIAVATVMVSAVNPVDMLLPERMIMPGNVRNQSFAKARATTAKNPLFGRIECAGVPASPVKWQQMFPKYRPGAKLTIPCGSHVTLDAEAGELAPIGALQIDGTLRISGLRSSTLSVQSILVQGKLLIGSRGRHASSKVTIKFLGGGDALNVERDGQKFDFGKKALVVLGGRLRMFGLPGGMDCVSKTWTSLVKRGEPGDSAVTLKGNLAGCWQVGHTIGFAPSYMDIQEMEERIITEVRVVSGNTLISLDSPLKFSHMGAADDYVAGGVKVPQASEVLLLSRNIELYGELEGTNGMHAIIAHTSQIQKIVGVKFTQGGQQGTLGRYPLHFHMCENSKGSLVEANSVVKSQQRGYVIHGTHSVNLNQNVAFENMGHNFMLEDGVEVDNVFTNNAAVGVLPPVKIIFAGGVKESDRLPSGFWIANADNTYEGNTCGGCKGACFWYEAKEAVRGQSADLPEAFGLNPKEVVVKSFKNNYAHTAREGLKMYPSGMTPPIDQQNVFQNVYIHHTEINSVFHHSGWGVTVMNSVFSDAGEVAVDFDRVRSTYLKDSVVVGKGPNNGVCPSLYGMEFHPSDFFGSTEFSATSLDTVTFDRFKDCITAPVSLGAEEDDDGDVYNDFSAVFGSFNSLTNVEFEDTPNSGVMIPNSVPGFPKKQWMNQVTMFVDGTGFMNGKTGFLISRNNPALFPVQKKKCSLKADMNAYFCTGVCYRTVSFSFEGLGEKYVRPWKVKFTRMADGQEEILDMPTAFKAKADFRYAFVGNLVGDEQYLVEVISPPGGQMGKLLRFEYQDGVKQMCMAGVDFIFPQRGFQYNIGFANFGLPLKVFRKPCAGTSNESSTKVMFYERCTENTPELVVQMPAGSLFGDMENGGGYMGVRKDDKAPPASCTSITGCEN